MDSAIGVHSGIDSPALALFNPKPQPHPKSPRASSLVHAPRTIVSRALHNARQGNVALLIVFLACLVIFVRALCGAGYDEGSSADADAAVQKHPSLLARWGPQSQHALEQQWRRLRSRSASSGLWAKIRKEDEHGARVLSNPHGHEHGPLHWLRAVEDRAFGWHSSASSAAVPDPDPLAHLQAPVHHVHAPEHDISEDLDAHDAVDDDDDDDARPPSSSSLSSPSPGATAGSETQSDSDTVVSPTAPSAHSVVPVPAPASDSARPEHADPAPAALADDSASSPAPEPVPAPAPSPAPAPAPAPAPPAHEIDPEHDDTDDEPVYHRRD